jgi:hypothetical protein
MDQAIASDTLKHDALAMLVHKPKNAQGGLRARFTIPAQALNNRRSANKGFAIAHGH